MQIFKRSAWLLLLWLLSSALHSSCVSTPGKSHTLYVLSLAPYPHSKMPNDTLNPSWDGGATLTPGVRLAVAEINNRTDILSDFRLELIEADCGCDLTFKTVNSYTEAVFYSGKQVVGVVGLACSDSAIVLAELTKKKALSILQVAIATSPSLRQYAYAPRPVSSSFEYVTTYLALIKLNRWKNIVILYDISRALFEATYLEFKHKLKALGDVDVAYESIITDTFIPIDAIVESNSRVVFAFLGPVAVKMMCVAAKNNVFFDTYQFIFHDRSLYEFNTNVTVQHNSLTYTCSDTLMMSAVNGSIFMQYHLNRTELLQSNATENVVLVSNKTYRTFFQEYLDTFYQVLKEPGHFLSRVTDLTYGPVDYDAVWSLALALNRSIPMLNQRGTPLQYYWPGLNNTDAIDTILDQFYNPPLSFTGASGQITFRNKSGDSATQIYIYQIFKNSMTLISSATNGNISDISDNQSRHGYIPDQFATESASIPLVGGVFIFILNGIALFLIIMFHIVNVVYQNHEYIKPSSPALNHLAFSGCYLFIISCLLFTVPRIFEQGLMVRGVLCNGFVWSLVLGLAMVFGTVTAKIWRIYRIFVFFNNPGHLLSNHLLILLVIALPTVDTVILLTWSLIDPLLASRMRRPLSSPDKVLIWYQYQCNNLAVWVALVTFIQSIVVVLLIIISIRARKVRSQYNHTKSINILIYILIFLVTLGVGVYGILIYNLDSSTVSTSLPLGDTLMCLVLVGTVYLFILFLFLPPWLPYLHQRLPLFQNIHRREVRTTPVAHTASFLTEKN